MLQLDRNAYLTTTTRLRLLLSFVTTDWVQDFGLSQIDWIGRCERMFVTFSVLPVDW